VIHSTVLLGGWNKRRCLWPQRDARKAGRRKRRRKWQPRRERRKPRARRSRGRNERHYNRCSRRGCLSITREQRRSFLQSVRKMRRIGNGRCPAPRRYLPFFIGHEPGTQSRRGGHAGNPPLARGLDAHGVAEFRRIDSWGVRRGTGDGVVGPAAVGVQSRRQEVGAKPACETRIAGRGRRHGRRGRSERGFPPPPAWPATS